MKRSFYVVLVVVSIILYGCDNRDWKVLFDGSDLSNFEIKKNPKDSLFNYFYVENELMVANSLNSKEHDYIWLQSQEEYADFELKLKFAFEEGTNGNSGIQFRSRYQDSTLWLDGPQIDINPPEMWRTGFVWDETIGNLRWIYPNIEKYGAQWAKPDMRNEMPEYYVSTSGDLVWNEMLVVAKGTKVVAYLNGTKITDLNGEGILNDEIHHLRKVGMKGHIALQIHKFSQLKIFFKDIYIRPLV